MFRNILVSIDGSAHADRALAEAIDMAESANARLTLITAVPGSHTWAYTPANAAALESLAVDLEKEAEQILRDAIDQIPPSISVTSILTHDPIRKALLRQVTAGCHDLLVMGSRGRGAVSAQILGSVSHFALNHCRIPVLIVHHESDALDVPGLDIGAAADDEQARNAAVVPAA